MRGCSGSSIPRSWQYGALLAPAAWGSGGGNMGYVKIAGTTTSRNNRRNRVICALRRSRSPRYRTSAGSTQMTPGKRAKSRAFRLSMYVRPWASIRATNRVSWACLPRTLCLFTRARQRTPMSAGSGSQTSHRPARRNPISASVGLRPKPLIDFGRVATARNSMATCAQRKTRSCRCSNRCKASSHTDWSGWPESLRRTRMFVSTSAFIARCHRTCAHDAELRQGCPRPRRMGEKFA